jgi:hypothetical protein
MLSNPDIAPSASINHWIVSILMFHFTLVHVAGTHHGPDRLSCHLPQPGDKSIHREEDFGDWIDHLHGFIHQINPLSTRHLVSHLPLPTYSLPIDFSKGEEITYDQVPHPKRAIRDDAHLICVRKWLDNLVRPPNLSESDYTMFVCYCTEFFLDSGHLWCKDSHGAHKITPLPDHHIKII